MKEVRLGIVGLGVMGQSHFESIPSMQGVRLTAVCDSDPKRIYSVKEKEPAIEVFAEHTPLLESGLVDGVIIATPHFMHPPVTTAAIERRIHVLTEKPVAVTIGAARRVNDLALAHPAIKFAAMFQQRTLPSYAKLHAMIRSGELGGVSRLTWIVTDWFRPFSYYAQATWRGTWRGEGGGVIINQAPHNLDLICWLAGSPVRRVTAVVALGKTHPIETEDEVSAIIEFENGAIGHFITTTGESPGTNLLEIAGDRGLARVEGGKLTVRRTAQSVAEFRRTSPGPFSAPAVTDELIELPESPPHPHRLIIQNFVNAILRDEPLIASGIEGAAGLELGNAMLLSGLRQRPVDVPLDADEFDALLAELQSRGKPA